MLLMNIIIIVALISITNGFVTNKFFTVKSRLYNNKLIENENIIGYKEEIDESIYVIIAFKNVIIDKLLDDMDYLDLQVIFCDISEYKKDELDILYNNYIKKENFSYKTQPWIFKNNEFIGGLFEIYSRIYKNI